MTLDGADGGVPPYRKIANSLRSDILSGALPIGAQLPTQAALVRRFGVSRAMIIRALEELRDNGYIDSRQGSGSYVRDRARGRPVPGPAGVLLSRHLALACEAKQVRIDVISLTCETLSGALHRPFERIRSGELRPESIALRLLLPANSAKLAVPRSTTDPEDDRPTQRFRRLAAGQTVSIESAVEALRDLDHVSNATVEIRGLPVTPLQKLYLLNGAEALFGHYEVVERSVTYRGDALDIYDVLGLGATLFHFSAGPSGDDGMGKEFVDRSQRWFDSLWNTISEPWDG
ncbi:GntR family transcriptional regulator [Actinacidiphila alni]|uniref:GntR family transcriptional regulator n=1 Tax=Actinacidiphila alni TaxID=380248 RepID=UPI0034527BCB